MSAPDVYLRPNVVVEPLVDNWYAWSHLISPATAGMNIRNRHLKIMESYVESPQMHATAARNPALQGGPFVDYETDRSAEIKDLIDETRRERQQMIAMAEAFTALDQILAERAKGYSLDPVYGELPDLLRGYVEITYDLNNQASFRVLEPLLYRSQFNDPTRQSLMLSLTDDDERPFVMSTPRLEDDRSVHIRIPFSSGAIDDLFRMKREARAYSSIKEQLGVRDEDEPVFSSLFTADAPPEYERYDGSGLRWRYFGHACILVETQSTSILLDPVLSYEYDSDVARYTYNDLPDEIDYVLITHNHQDHILFETILQLRHKVKHFLVPRNGGGSLQDPSLKLMLNNIGFANVTEMDELEAVPTATGTITALPFFGEHADLGIRTKTAWLVEDGGRNLLFAADSCNVEPRLYEHLHPLVGDIDALFLGMECDGAPLSWLYGPLLTRNLPRDMDQSRRLAGSNHEHAIGIVDRLSCKAAYVYAMGQEPWLNYVMATTYTAESNPIIASDRLIEACLQRGLSAERLFGEREILLA